LVFLSSAPLVSIVPLLRREPYNCHLVVQEPIPRAGVAINLQPQRAMPVPLTRASTKSISQIASISRSPWLTTDFMPHCFSLERARGQCVTDGRADVTEAARANLPAGGCPSGLTSPDIAKRSGRRVRGFRPLVPLPTQQTWTSARSVAGL